MRSSVELLDLPFVFSQKSLLTVSQLRDAASERGVRLSVRDVEAFHQTGLLTPFLRVRRDRHLIRRLSKDNRRQASHVARWQATHAPDLIAARAAQNLFDPAAERFTAWSRRARDIDGLEYNASEFLYSPYQLLTLPMLADALPHLYVTETGKTVLRVGRHWLPWAQRWGADVRAIAIAASALEARYLPRILRSLTLHEHEYAAYDRWIRTARLTAVQRWLGCEAGWLQERAEHLLHRADQNDPLGQWFDIVREADPSSWMRLKGTALSAIDLRIAAELLLRYYEDLAKGRRAKPLPARPTTVRGSYRLDHRLKATGSLERTLTSFGLSPHPCVLLVVEGATETTMLGHLIAHYGIRTDDDLLAIQDREGIAKDLAALIAYAIAPRTEPELDPRYLQLRRPITQLLVVCDAEGPMLTKSKRNTHRDNWVQRVMRTLPLEHRTDRVENTVRDLIHIETWRRDGESFEFAHFTDRQLATAITAVDKRPRRPDETKLVSLVAACRARRGNLDDITGAVSKVTLVDALWPALQTKITRAEARGADERIPIVRVLRHALDLAARTPRGNRIIEL